MRSPARPRSRPSSSRPPAAASSPASNTQLPRPPPSSTHERHSSSYSDCCETNCSCVCRSVTRVAAISVVPGRQRGIGDDQQVLYGRPTGAVSAPVCRVPHEGIGSCPRAARADAGWGPAAGSDEGEATIVHTSAFCSTPEEAPILSPLRKSGGTTSTAPDSGPASPAHRPCTARQRCNGSCHSPATELRVLTRLRAPAAYATASPRRRGSSPPCTGRAGSRALDRGRRPRAPRRGARRPTR